MWTKRTLVEEAYAELALANWVWDLQPEEIQWAVNRMDMMLSLWAAKGINVGYPLSDGSGSDPEQSCEVLAFAVPAIVLNLARSIATGKGKQLSQIPETLRAARDALSFLETMAAQPGTLQKPYYLPVGAGSKPWRYYWGPFIYQQAGQTDPKWPPPSDKAF